MEDLLKSIECPKCKTKMDIGIKDTAEYESTFIKAKDYVDYVKDLMKGEEKNTELLEDVLEQTELVAIHPYCECEETDESNIYSDNEFVGNLVTINNSKIKIEYVDDLTFIELNDVVGLEEYHRLHNLMKDIIRNHFAEVV